MYVAFIAEIELKIVLALHTHCNMIYDVKLNRTLLYVTGIAYVQLIPPFGRIYDVCRQTLLFSGHVNIMSKHAQEYLDTVLIKTQESILLNLLLK